ncbi:MAG: N-acetyl-gamma-glutamyl-phosphate reductase [Acidiferrobacteraceae bacterium]|jgi:N-acetyl-gamma-glutamyl-phosphate/LysW-gamma-L-alpha-aminoadipyl-6-phosphate reductase|nr:N-acetyl-gamma-glutamyl-phosphate reductase [Acidiferrobacteraceae bacterium]MDP6552324.1 N-acetyl-gamma-glutamyl-phosphate reductase [Arenicellales bacterium]MDP6790389.1 N-acetyl-gamma-glutamyl-phosphate reductase [Arenicellales bacterium]MDP6919590.1 N-acetyl-gamma-glutamyl-phosphate reductase [Arenicellales bacterium]|tara:strand:- start:5880 stop:6905 length:1026 start_codon:yes stop_codon:yes gene_type:complete
MINVSIVGGSGYTGGELLRLLLLHEGSRVTQVTSERFAGKAVHKAHPNLRKACALKFCTLGELEPCDVLFLCLPHRKTAERFDAFSALAPRIIDLSADFRLSDPDVYAEWYGQPHPRPELLERFVYGIPELHRSEIQAATHVACGGCNATASTLALAPLARRNLISSVVIDVKAGSSEGGNAASEASHHPERSGAVRSYRPTRHRHVAEITQSLGDFPVYFSATSIEMVRGILATCHVFLNEPRQEKEIWGIYREDYANEPFIRIVKERSGIHRYPEPKLLSGSNFCDIGFEIDAGSTRLVMISAIDNLMKGAAGQAVQCFNIMQGLDESTGLTFPGLHPI